MAYKQLTRSMQDRKIAGVCGGLGEHFDIDPLIFRIIFLFLLLCAGGGFLLYLIMWLIMPEKKSYENVQTFQTENVKEKFEENDNHSQNICNMKKNKGIFWGLLLVAFGALWLGRTFGLFSFSWCTVMKLWPMLIIWAGIMLLPIEQIWKNVCSFVLLAIAIILLFFLPENSCCKHHHFWNDKYQYEITKKVKDADCEVEEEDVDVDLNLNADDESISVSVENGVVTINSETNEDGEKKVVVKKIKL